MFGDNSSKLDVSNSAEVFAHLIKEMDEVKRYVAATYASVDNEVKELHNMVLRVEKQLKETDGQVDRLERLDSVIRKMESTMKNIERKMPR